MTTTPNTQALEIGTVVRVEVPADDPLMTTSWWPKAGPVFGTVERVFKNGRVAVAVHDLHNFSDDRMKTLHIERHFLREAADD